ncbi:MAG: hypothetical protein ABFE13_07280 [Phycisphaerales bacterium]
MRRSITSIAIAIVAVLSTASSGALDLSGQYWFGSVSVDPNTNAPWAKRGTASITESQWDQEWDDYDGHHTFSSAYATETQADGSIDVVFSQGTYNIAWNGDVMIHAGTVLQGGGEGIDVFTRKATDVDVNDVLGHHSYFGYHLDWASPGDSCGWGDFTFDPNGTVTGGWTNDRGVMEEPGTLNWTLDGGNATINLMGEAALYLGKGGVAFAWDIDPEQDAWGTDVGYASFIQKTDQTITMADIAGTYQIRFLETGPGSVPYTCGQGTCVIEAVDDVNGTLSLDAYFSDGEHDVSIISCSVGPGNEFHTADNSVPDGIVSPDKNLIFVPEYQYENPPTRTADDWLGGGFLIKNTLSSDVSEHVLKIEMSKTHNYCYDTGTTFRYQFDAAVQADDTVSSITMTTPGGSEFTLDLEVEDGERWFNHHVSSLNEADLAVYTAGTYTFTVHYAAGGSDTTTVLYALPGGEAIPPVTQQPVLLSPADGAIGVPPTVTFTFETPTDPNWTIGLEWEAVTDSNDGGGGNVADDASSYGPVALSASTEYEVVLAINHAISGTNPDGIPTVVDTDAEERFTFTTGDSVVLSVVDYGVGSSSAYGVRTFEWTYGRSGEWKSRMGDEVVVNYGDGTSFTGIETTNIAQANAQIWNEVVEVRDSTIIVLTLGSFQLSSDPNLTSHPDAWSFETASDGMLVNLSPYYLIRTNPSMVLLREDQMLLYQVQDVSVLFDSYTDALISWTLDANEPYADLNFHGKETDLGIVLPTSADTSGYAVTGFRIRGLGAGIIALGRVDPETGELLDLGELREVDTYARNDWNGDGIVSIVGDVPPFVQCVYFDTCPAWPEERLLCVGDCNRDGILSIVGDVPCFVNCVYFSNCPE